LFWLNPAIYGPSSDYRGQGSGLTSNFATEPLKEFVAALERAMGRKR
jgi:hypothetical protein